MKCKDLNAELLRADLERIYEAAASVYKNKHVTKALNTKITDLNMTFGLLSPS